MSTQQSAKLVTIFVIAYFILNGVHQLIWVAESLPEHETIATTYWGFYIVAILVVSLALLVYVSKTHFENDSNGTAILTAALRIFGAYAALHGFSILTTAISSFVFDLEGLRNSNRIIAITRSVNALAYLAVAFMFCFRTKYLINLMDRK